MAAYLDKRTKKKVGKGAYTYDYLPGESPAENPNEYEITATGGLQRKEHPNWLQRNLWWLAPVGMAAGAGVGALVGGDGAPALAPAAGTTAGYGSVPLTGLTAAQLEEMGIGASGIGATATGATTAAAAAKGASMALSPRDYIDLVMFGGKTLLDRSAMNKQIAAGDRAAQIQAQSDREALALLREQWQKDQENLAPYYALGKTATGRLNTGLAEMQSPGALPANVQQFMQTGSRPSTVANYGMASVLAPDRSEVRRFAPGDPKLAGHLQRGWTRV